MQKYFHMMITSFIFVQSKEDYGFFQGKSPLVGLRGHLTSPQSHQVLFVKAKPITVCVMFMRPSQLSSGMKASAQGTVPHTFAEAGSSLLSAQLLCPLGMVGHLLRVTHCLDRGVPLSGPGRPGGALLAHLCRGHTAGLMEGPLRTALCLTTACLALPHIQWNFLFH